jgi:DNA helicase II / ATP-dependent DNA helicase PcrA
MSKETEVLNEEQAQAVFHGEGPLLVIAGAGTGKTRVITERIKHLLTDRQVKPEEILALTFTEKAAREMEERVDRVLPTGMSTAWIMTFHSFCERILRDEAIHIGLDPGYKIITQAESFMFIKENLPRFELTYYAPLSNPTKFISSLVTHFNRLRDEDISPQEYEDYINKMKKEDFSSEELKRMEEVARAYKLYQDLKIERSLMDYADLIYYTLRLFQARPNVLEQFRLRFRYILVDEFQDTNYAQNQLLLHLTNDQKNILVVGDDDQSIFRWRGAAVHNVLGFDDHFPEAVKVTLKKNYRTGQEILDRSYELIRYNNPDRLEEKIGVDKKLVSAIDSDSSIHFIFEERVEDEAEAVAEEVAQLVESGKYGYKDFAILIRANNHNEPFLRSLGRRGIPFQFMGPGKLYHQKEIKDLLAYLKILDDFRDNTSLYRILTNNLRIYSRDMASLVSFSRRENESLWEILEDEGNYKGLSKETVSSLKNFVRLFHEHLRLLPSRSVGEIVYLYLQDTGRLKELADKEGSAEFENLTKFFDKLKSFEVIQEDSSVASFLEYLELVLETGDSPLASDTGSMEANAVNILTIHSSKGLEFPVVFMVNLVNLRFPSVNRKEQIPLPEGLIKEPLPSVDLHTAEERRLFYVGMTRAKERLYLTAAKYYSDNYSRPKKLSQFVEEALQNTERYLHRRVRTPSLFDYVLSMDKPTDTKVIQPKLGEYVSYSALNTFEICPLQYKYSYILRIPTPTAAPSAYGNSIHNIMRDFYQLIMKGKEVSEETMIQLLQKNWISEGYESKDIENKRKTEATRQLGEYYQRHFVRLKIPIHIEKSFNIKVGEVFLKGKVDRIDPLPGGGVEIIDYKTSKIPTDKEVAKDLQLSLYALAVNSPDFLNIPLEKIKLSFYHFEDGQFRSTTRTEEDLETAREYIAGKVTEIEMSDFAPRVNFLCEYCQFQMLCDAYQGSLKSG